MAHFLMMGANEERDGAFLSEDVEFSSSFSTRSERNQADLQRAISRYRDFTPGRYGRFLARKLLTVYNDGTFAWGAEGTFLSILYPPVNHRISPLLRSIFYYAYSDDQNNGALFPYYALFAQLVWLNILLLSLLSCFVRHPAPHQKAFSILALALIGLTAYEILFEGRRKQRACRRERAPCRRPHACPAPVPSASIHPVRPPEIRLINPMRRGAAVCQLRYRSISSTEICWRAMLTA